MTIGGVALAKRIQKWQKKLAPLGVGHFQIDAVHMVDEVPGSDGSLAAVTIVRSYDRCEFWFSFDFIEAADSYSLDKTIVHEWLHVAMRDLDVALLSPERWMPPATFEDWRERVNHEEEGLVDRLSVALTDALL